MMRFYYLRAVFSWELGIPPMNSLCASTLPLRLGPDPSLRPSLCRPRGLEDLNAPRSNPGLWNHPRPRRRLRVERLIASSVVQERVERRAGRAPPRAVPVRVERICAPSI